MLEELTHTRKYSKYTTGTQNGHTFLKRKKTYQGCKTDTKHKTQTAFP